MKEIVVLSGKGGTGKTSIVGSLAALAERKVLADCDVDAADLHLLLKPSAETGQRFRSGRVANIDRINARSVDCVKKLCRFHAIKIHSRCRILRSCWFLLSYIYLARLLP